MHKFSNHNINLFCCCEKLLTYMNIWMIGKTSLKRYYLKQKRSYNHLNIEDITGADHMHVKRFWKDFEIKTLDEYYHFHFQSNILLLADVFENFWNTYLEIYELECACFLTALGLEWQEESTVKEKSKRKSKIRSIN